MKLEVLFLFIVSLSCLLSKDYIKHNLEYIKTSNTSSSLNSRLRLASCIKSNYIIDTFKNQFVDSKCQHGTADLYSETLYLNLLNREIFEFDALNLLEVIGMSASGYKIYAYKNFESANETLNESLLRGIGKFMAKSISDRVTLQMDWPRIFYKLLFDQPILAEDIADYYRIRNLPIHKPSIDLYSLFDESGFIIREIKKYMSSIPDASEIDAEAFIPPNIYKGYKEIAEGMRSYFLDALDITIKLSSNVKRRKSSSKQKDSTKPSPKLSPKSIFDSTQYSPTKSPIALFPDLSTSPSTFVSMYLPAPALGRKTVGLSIEFFKALFNGKLVTQSDLSEVANGTLAELAQHEVLWLSLLTTGSITVPFGKLVVYNNTLFHNPRDQIRKFAANNQAMPNLIRMGKTWKPLACAERYLRFPLNIFERIEDGCTSFTNIDKSSFDFIASHLDVLDNDLIGLFNYYVLNSHRFLIQPKDKHFYDLIQNVQSPSLELMLTEAVDGLGNHLKDEIEIENSRVASSSHFLYPLNVTAEEYRQVPPNSVRSLFYQHRRKLLYSIYEDSLGFVSRYSSLSLFKDRLDFIAKTYPNVQKFPSIPLASETLEIDLTAAFKKLYLLRMKNHGLEFSMYDSVANYSKFYFGAEMDPLPRVLYLNFPKGRRLFLNFLKNLNDLPRELILAARGVIFNQRTQLNQVTQFAHLSHHLFYYGRDVVFKLSQDINNSINYDLKEGLDDSVYEGLGKLFAIFVYHDQPLSSLGMLSQNVLKLFVIGAQCDENSVIETAIRYRKFISGFRSLLGIDHFELYESKFVTVFLIGVSFAPSTSLFELLQGLPLLLSMIYSRAYVKSKYTPDSENDKTNGLLFRFKMLNGTECVPFEVDDKDGNLVLSFASNEECAYYYGAYNERLYRHIPVRNAVGFELPLNDKCMDSVVERYMSKNLATKYIFTDTQRQMNSRIEASLPDSNNDELVSLGRMIAYGLDNGYYLAKYRLRAKAIRYIYEPFFLKDNLNDTIYLEALESVVGVSSIPLGSRDVYSSFVFGFYSHFEYRKFLLYFYDQQYFEDKLYRSLDNFVAAIASTLKINEHILPDVSRKFERLLRILDVQFPIIYGFDDTLFSPLLISQMTHAYDTILGVENPEEYTALSVNPFADSKDLDLMHMYGPRIKAKNYELPDVLDFDQKRKLFFAFSSLLIDSSKLHVNENSTVGWDKLSTIRLPPEELWSEEHSLSFSEDQLLSTAYPWRLSNTLCATVKVLNGSESSIPQDIEEIVTELAHRLVSILVRRPSKLPISFFEQVLYRDAPPKYLSFEKEVFLEMYDRMVSQITVCPVYGALRGRFKELRLHNYTYVQVESFLPINQGLLTLFGTLLPRNVALKFREKIFGLLPRQVLTEWFTIEELAKVFNKHFNQYEALMKVLPDKSNSVALRVKYDTGLQSVISQNPFLVAQYLEGTFYNNLGSSGQLSVKFDDVPSRGIRTGSSGVTYVIPNYFSDDETLDDLREILHPFGPSSTRLRTFSMLQYFYQTLHRENFVEDQIRELLETRSRALTAGEENDSETNSEEQEEAEDSPVLVEEESDSDYETISNSGSDDYGSMSSEESGETMLDVQSNSHRAALMIDRNADARQFLNESCEYLRSLEYFQPIFVIYENQIGQDAGGLTSDWIGKMVEYFLSESPLEGTRNDAWKILSALEPELAECAGRFLARALIADVSPGYDLPIHFINGLFRMSLTLDDLKSLDQGLGNALEYVIDNREQIEDLGLFFNLQGRDLISDGVNVAVTKENLDQYVQLFLEHYLLPQNAKEIHEGFNKVIDTDDLLCFQDIPTVHAFYRGSGSSSFQFEGAQIVLDWKEHTVVVEKEKYRDQIKWFWEFVSESNPVTRQKLFTFITGLKYLPYLGFVKLNPQMIIVFTNSTDSHFPQSHTCSNQLDLPAYTRKKTLFKQVSKVLEEDHGFQIA